MQKEEYKRRVFWGTSAGQWYCIRRGNPNQGPMEGPEYEQMKLVEYSQNVVVFENVHGAREAFTYSAVYNSIMRMVEA